MKIARFRQPAVSALAVLMISGAGIAFAGNAAPAAPAVTAAPAVETAAPAVEPTVAPVEPVGPDTDLIEDGTPDTPAEAAAEKAGTETETPGVEEPGDENLPGGGHADDPNDPNADHQFEGTE
jgi:hypothetical protein